MQRAKTLSLLLAGLLAGGAAVAQTATATSNVPVQAGEASTVTHGVPNMAPNNYGPAPVAPVVVSPAPVVVSPAPVYVTPEPVVVVPAQPAVSSASGVAVDSASSTSVMGASGITTYRDPVAVSTPGATVTSNVPRMAGEASTMTNGVPNMSTNNAVVDDARIVYMERTIAEIPPQAGEASTMVNGRPNANPHDPVIRR